MNCRMRLVAIVSYVILAFCIGGCGYDVTPSYPKRIALTPTESVDIIAECAGHDNGVNVEGIQFYQRVVTDSKRFDNPANHTMRIEYHYYLEPSGKRQLFDDVCRIRVNPDPFFTPPNILLYNKADDVIILFWFTPPVLAKEEAKIVSALLTLCPNVREK